MNETVIPRRMRIGAPVRPGMRVARLALVIGYASMLGLAPVVAAAPSGTPAPTFGTPKCGNDDDKDRIWNGVKGASPSDFKTNLDVVFPTGEPSRGYALHNGKEAGQPNPYDFLLVPTIRETGIECTNLITDHPPEYFTEAYKYVASAPKGLPKGTDWALGIESGDPGARSANQLHIHVSRLAASTRTSLDKVAGSCAPHEDQWLKSKVVVSTSKGDRTFRCWNSTVMTHDFFGKVNDAIVKPLKVSMSNEALLITANKAGGFLVLSSDHAGPDLNKNGVNNIEGLLNKG